MSTPEFTCVLSAELPAPLANGLVGDGDSALREKVFDVSEAQTEAVIEPDRMTDDLWRKAMAAIAGRAAVHSPSLTLMRRLDSTAGRLNQARN